MVKVKKYDYSKNIIDYGFVKLETKNSKLLLPDVIASVKENIIVVDTNSRFFLKYLADFSSCLNQTEKLFIGLVDKQTLNSLHDKGVRTGFIRSTNLMFETGLIIVDKKEVYCVLDSNRIYELANKEVTKEIFDYVNHIIWSKTNFELFQGGLANVNEIRQSVVMPGLNNATMVPDSVNFSTERNMRPGTLLLKKEDVINESAKVLATDINAFTNSFPGLAIELFEKKYYLFNVDEDSIIRAESFSKKPLSELDGKKLWVNGKEFEILKNDLLESEERVPLDLVDSYSPDFDSKAEKYSNYTLELEIRINVLPIKLDNSFSLSNRYKTIARVESELNDGLAKLLKLDLEKKLIKQLESIKSERLLINRVKMFNEFVASKEFGVDALNNKKSPVSIINVNEEELNVPNELIGKLYTKQSKNYLATTKERIADAKKWLKENKMEAVLIEA